MTFNDLIGQKIVINSLKNSIKNNKVAHAYIFEGPEGIGKKVIASIFATSLVCSRERNSNTRRGEPCMTCRNCVQSQNGNHPDIRVIDADSDKTSTASIKVDTIRELQKDLYIRPYESDKKVYIIPRAGRMTEQAQNSLLKIFEEPPGRSVIILTVENALQLLETILSRAILIRFRMHPPREIEEYLRKHFPLLEDKIPILASFSGGVIGRAKLLATSDEFRQIRQNVIEMMMKLLYEDQVSALEMTALFIDNRLNIDLILEMMLSWFRDIIIIKELHDEQKVMNIDVLNKLEEFSSSVLYGSMLRIIYIIMDMKRKIAMNANYSLAIETMLIQSWEEIHGKGSRSKI